MSSAARRDAINLQAVLLQVRGLSVTYHGVRSLIGRRRSHKAVDDVSFDIAERQTFGLVGESGSGKSTIGRAVLRIVTPVVGSISFDGEEITAWGPRTPLRYRRAVQVVFQDPSTSLNPRMTVRETIAESVHFHLRLTGRARETRVRELLDSVGLGTHLADRLPHELSGGQQQRVAIARALVPSPQLLVCDEAVSALDVSTQSQVINLLQDLQQEYGMSYLFISHDLSVVRHISHRLAVLERGRIVESGDAEAIYRAPSDPYTQRLLASIPRLDTSERHVNRPEEN